MYFTLFTHDQFVAFAFQFFGDLIRQIVSGSSLLARVDKRTETLEPCFLYKSEKLIKVLVGLSGKTGHNGCAQIYAGNAVSELGNDFAYALLAVPAVHALKHRR